MNGFFLPCFDHRSPRTRQSTFRSWSRCFTSEGSSTEITLFMQDFGTRLARRTTLFDRDWRSSTWSTRVSPAWRKERLVQWLNFCMLHLAARGLDVNPVTISKFKKAKDLEAVGALEIIHSDEVTRTSVCPASYVPASPLTTLLSLPFYRCDCRYVKPNCLHLISSYAGLFDTDASSSMSSTNQGHKVSPTSPAVVSSCAKLTLSPLYYDIAVVHLGLQERGRRTRSDLPSRGLPELPRQGQGAVQRAGQRSSGTLPLLNTSILSKDHIS